METVVSLIIFGHLARFAVLHYTYGSSSLFLIFLHVRIPKEFSNWFTLVAVKNWIWSCWCYFMIYQLSYFLHYKVTCSWKTKMDNNLLWWIGIVITDLRLIAAFNYRWSGANSYTISFTTANMVTTAAHFKMYWFILGGVSVNIHDSHKVTNWIEISVKFNGFIVRIQVERNLWAHEFRAKSIPRHWWILIKVSNSDVVGISTHLLGFGFES